MIIHPSIFKISNISKWQINGYVELPKVQRGFVWKPNQIEDLWDSLLRKYPVGSFVFNKQKDGKLQLLDGQQRATAITLGFANKTFRNSDEHLRIFIDLELPVNDARKYYFRVITDSHPWGYQRKPNNKPLDAEQKREAVKYWDNVDLINPDLNLCFPYDATIPVPLSFFLDAENDDQLYQTITNWPLWERIKLKLKDYIHKNTNRIAKEDDPQMLNNNEKFLKERIRKIYADIKQMLNHQEIPALYMDDVLESSKYNEVDQKTNEDQNAEQEHEVENLFVRLNSGGTPLRGEELNYSILKSKIDSKTQEKVEKACEYFITPARFITVAFRLYQYVDKNHKGRDALSMNIKPRQFQSRLNDKKEVQKFEQYILRLIEKKEYGGKTLIEYSKYILEYHPSYNPSGFPHLVAKKLINNSPELLFMFWYRVVVKKDLIVLDTAKINSLHKRMLGMYSIFLWFGKGDSNRDYSNLLKNIWPAMKVLDTDKFWSSASVKRAMLNDVLLPIPLFSKNTVKNPGIKWFIKQNPKLKTSLFDRFYKLSNAAFNTGLLFFNTDLVLYAQRDFLHDIFKNKQFHLDDSNVPFDWDHIYPKSLINNKKNLPRLIKEFYESIGNFRAWPYELNRMDSDALPYIKFNPAEYSEDIDFLKQSWKRFIEKHKDLEADFHQISKNLLMWSVCATEWAKSEIGDIKKGDAKEVFKLIVTRAVDLIGKWYTELLIEDLIPIKLTQHSSVIREAFSYNKIDLNPSWIKDKAYKEEWDTTDTDNLLLKKTININGNPLNFYISYSKNPDEQLNEDNILFGFYDKERSNVFDSIKVSDDGKYDLNKKDYYLQGQFTLVSAHEESVKQLLTDIAVWINNKQFPLFKYRTEIKQILADALLKKYKTSFE